MAIASVSPSAIRRGATTQSAPSAKRADLRLVTQTATERGADKKAFALFLISMAVAGLLALLAINTALSQGAFELTKLNSQATALNDEREAVMKKIAKASSPEVLAYRAKVAGMVSSQSPRFLVVGPPRDRSTPAQFVKDSR
ncbi:MAG: hypothetical protein H7227_03455 [Actinobacteria bacterium]|nr:hypothetical protein [Actinomycetota bacterium]